MSQKKKILLAAFGAFVMIALIYLFFSTSKQNKNSDLIENQINSDSVSQAGLLVTDSSFIMTETERPDQIILCKKFKSNYKSIKSLIVKSAPDLLKIISEKNLAIKGSIQALYFEVPTNEFEKEIFVGIPIGKKIAAPSEEYQIIEIPASGFVKVKSNSNWGESLDLWNKIVGKLTVNGKKIKYPIIEYPSDSRNAEMTTEISQMNLMIPIN